MVLVPVVLLLPQRAGSAEEAPTAEEIARAVEDLGSDSYVVRERASALLWQAGRAAEPALTDAARSDDPEVVARARRILRSFHYGIFPDTPQEVVRLISQFRHGTQPVRLAALRRLLELDETSTLMALVDMEQDQEARQQLVEGLLKNFDKIAGRLFIDLGRLAASREKAERLLEMGAVSASGMRNYAAYLLLRGQIDAKIAELRKRLTTAASSADARRLAYLLRAKGDLPAARRVAEKSTDFGLREGLLLESGQWKELAVIYDKAGRDVSGNLAGGIVHLGYAAAFHRLAGNSKEFQEAIDGIQRLAQFKPNKIRYCAEALMVNDCFAEAIEMCRKQGGTAEFEILVRQRRFREALAVAGVDDPRGPYSLWFAGLDVDASRKSGETRARFEMGVAVAVTLHQLAEREQATRLFEELAQAAVKRNGLSMRAVCEAEYRLGLIDDAFRHAGAVLDTEWRLTLLRTLFPEHQRVAELWWGLLCRRRPDEPRKVTLGTLRGVLSPDSAKSPTSPDWLRFVKEVEKETADLGPQDRGNWLTALGETCLVRGDSRLAESYFQRAAEAAPSVGVLVQLGDLAARRNDWREAARWYAKAWDADRGDPTALFLQGRALVEAGRESDGRPLIDAAKLLPLGNAETRHAMAETLYNRGLTEEAVRQWQVVVRTGELRSWAVAEAAKRLGTFHAGRDDLAAARYWQWPLLRCLRTSSTIVSVQGYLETTHRIHKARARGLLAAGRVEEALREIDLSLASLPGETALAIELVPLLRKAGRGAEADDLFEKVFAVNQRVCEDFPKATHYHEELARLAAQCREASPR